MASTKKPAAKPPTKPSNNNSRIILGIVGAVVVVAAVVAIIAATSGGSEESVFAEGATIREFQGVIVDGDPLPPATDGAADPALGMDAPGLTGAYFDGTEVTVTPGDGSPYMLVFLAHWCPHCNAEVPRLVEWYEEGGVPEGLKVVGIATGSDQTAQHWPPSDWLMNEMNWPLEWSAMADSPQYVARDTYGLSGYPFMVIIDEEGKVVLRTSGEKGKEEVDRMVDAALGLSGEDTAATTP